MNNVLLFLIIILVTGCTDYYSSINEDLELIKKYQFELSDYLSKSEYKAAIERAKLDNKNGIVVYMGDASNQCYDLNYMDGLKKGGDSVLASKLQDINTCLIVINTCKVDFYKLIKKVDDDAKQLELIKKFDRIYILKIEK